MPTYSYEDSVGQKSFSSDGRVRYFETRLDFAEIVAARASQGLTALVATDIIEAITIPADSVVLHAGLEVTKAETTNTTATFDLGYTTGSPAAANVFANDAASNAVAIHHTALAAPIVTGTADDAIDLLLNTAVPTDCVIRVFALVLDTTE